MLIRHLNYPFILHLEKLIRFLALIRELPHIVYVNLQPLLLYADCLLEFSHILVPAHQFALDAV